jgi:AraC-like DNA-binding protein
LNFRSYKPQQRIEKFVKEIWLIENPDTRIKQEKIIPDGYCEIIIHYGDPYRINISGNWELQTKFLFAGQIRSYFFLENTGKSGMIGIKLYPEVFARMFQVNMSLYFDRVIDLQTIGDSVEELKLINEQTEDKKKIEIIENWLLSQINENKTKINSKISMLIREMINDNGMLELDKYTKEFEISKRELERQFKKLVGLAPKFFLRILRLSYIFKQVQKKDFSWTELAYKNGFYDQSHFIKNFKEFTGESPKKYGFDETNFANFFLKK